jgi:hypothetical protein
MIDVERSPVPPPSLSARSRWDALDVRRALERDFYGKCYLCERLVSLGEAEVDHRVPRSVWREGSFEWRNLFPSCRYCNMRRLVHPADAELLSPGQGVETRILQRARTSDDGVSVVCEFGARHLGDRPADRAAEELRHIHSVAGATTGRAAAAAQELLDKIHDHYFRVLYPQELKVLRGRQRGEPDATAEAELARLVSRRAPFTMLMRSMVHPVLRDLFD